MNFFDDSTLKKILYTFLAVLIVATLVVFSIYIWYGNKVVSDDELYSLETEESDYNTEEASSTSDKNILDVNNSISKNIINNTSTNTVSSELNDVQKSAKVNTVKKENEASSVNATENNVQAEAKPEKKKELDFDAPVDGEIIKDFANETLVYSKTLDEWTTHLGVDIKGDKTSIVKSAEDGTVESIKNDPRFGLTITISHQDGYKTVYSNLLTTEFVKEGDNVSKGDTIATIGETASFEILDEPHLHFELYKDENAVNPTLYLK